MNNDQVGSFKNVLKFFFLKTNLGIGSRTLHRLSLAHSVCVSNLLEREGLAQNDHSQLRRRSLVHDSKIEETIRNLVIDLLLLVFVIRSIGQVKKIKRVISAFNPLFLNVIKLFILK